MIDKTILVDDISERKQVSMPFWAYFALKQASSKRTNRTFTKGIVAYEALLLANDQYKDSFTKIESQIDADLSDTLGTDISEPINKIKFANGEDSKFILANEVTDGDPYTTAERVNLHLPVTLCDQFDGRGLGHEVARSLIHVTSAPWSSRLERADVKRQIMTYAKGERVDEPHPFVDAIIQQDTSTWDIQNIISACAPDNPWEDPNITFESLQPVAMDIPHTSKKRVPALQLAVNNLEESMTQSDVFDWIMNHMDVDTPATAQKYVDNIEFDNAWGINVDWVIEEMTSRADYIRTVIPDDHPLQSKSDHELIGLTDGVYDVDGVYDSTEAAEDAIDSITTNNSSSPLIREQQDAFFSLIKMKLEFANVVD